MGGFIIGAENGCNQCGLVTHDDGSRVTWRCSTCQKLVCRYCAQREPTGREILCITLCSPACKNIRRTENTMLQQPDDTEE